jgi:hypothetical protein
MGLDMYAFTTTTALTQMVDFPEPDDIRRLHYWRKRWDLHEWMKEVYHRKGGKDPDFNMAPVVLDIADLAILETSILNKLPKPESLFSDGSERDADLAFIFNARSEIAEGKSVFYLSWW